MKPAPTDTGADRKPGTGTRSSGPNEWIAPAAWRQIDFISDLHLAADMPLTFAAWQHYLLGTEADGLVILGDLFDAWVGDDARHGGFEAKAAAVLKEATRRRPVALMVGNRDFLLGVEMLDDCGVIALPDPTVLQAFGARTLLSHGDAWCLGDLEYQRMRRIVRDPAWQREVLAMPVAERRVLAGRMRTASENRSSSRLSSVVARSATVQPESPTGWFDVDSATALGALAEANADVLVHGHTHQPATEALAPGAVRHVLSDWDLDHAATPRAEVLRWHQGGWMRISPAQAVGAAGR